MKLSLIININNKELVKNVRQIHRKLEDETNSFSYSVHDYHILVLNLMPFVDVNIDNSILNNYKSIFSECFKNVKKFNMEFYGFTVNRYGRIIYAKVDSPVLKDIRNTILIPTLKKNGAKFIDEMCKPGIPLVVNRNAKILLAERLNAEDNRQFLGTQEANSIGFVINDFYIHSRFILDRYFLS